MLKWCVIGQFWLRRIRWHANVHLSAHGQLSIEEFYSPFGGKLDPNNRWVLLHKLIPWMPLESHYAPQFAANTGGPAKPFQMAFGAVYIQQRLGVTDRETMELITESPYLQFFIGLSGYQPLPPFDPSMMVHVRKRIGPDLIKVCNAITKAGPRRSAASDELWFSKFPWRLRENALTTGCCHRRVWSAGPG
jgi:hypothetical protein